MADITIPADQPRPREAHRRFVEIGDGTYAEVFAVAGTTGAGAVGVVVMNFATNGDTFPADSATSYTYDETGVNIETVTKTTNEGVSYRQTWTRDSQAQLSLRSGWVRQ